MQELLRLSNCQQEMLLNARDLHDSAMKNVRKGQAEVDLVLQVCMSVLQCQCCLGHLRLFCAPVNSLVEAVRQPDTSHLHCRVKH
jgi:hypothetical protein